MLVTSVVVTNYNLPNSLRKAIGTIPHATLKELIQKGFSNPQFYGDLVYE